MNYFDEAREYLPSSNCLRRHYACVLVNREGHIVSVGYNNSRIECKTCARENIPHNAGNYAECPAIHAEVMALMGPGLDHSINALQGYKLYLVCDKDDNPTPCPHCQKLLDWAGVEVVKEEK